jgi:hypothetical protein
VTCRGNRAGRDAQDQHCSHPADSDLQPDRKLPGIQRGVILLFSCWCTPHQHCNHHGVHSCVIFMLSLMHRIPPWACFSLIHTVGTVLVAMEWGPLLSGCLSRDAREASCGDSRCLRNTGRLNFTYRGDSRCLRNTGRINFTYRGDSRCLRNTGRLNFTYRSKTSSGGMDEQPCRGFYCAAAAAAPAPVRPAFSKSDTKIRRTDMLQRRCRSSSIPGETQLVAIPSDCAHHAVSARQPDRRSRSNRTCRGDQDQHCSHHAAAATPCSCSTSADVGLAYT